MSTVEQSKINQLLERLPPHTVALSGWLKEQGYSHDLQKRYRQSGWLTSIGSGAMIRTGEKLNYLGAVYALQSQLKLSIHPGGRTALQLLGKAHYLEIGNAKVHLFGNQQEKLPSWFKSNTWDRLIEYHSTSFLPGDTGFSTYEQGNFSIKISGSARAIMESLYLSPRKMDLLECYEIMEGLNNLIPHQVQSLLETCNSVKVKRLFLYLAEKAGHKWLDSLKLDTIDLGRGKRSIVKDGIYIPKFQITVPKDLGNNGSSIL